MVHFWYDWDWSGALQEFERSISLNPNYATAIQWYALALSALGRHDEAFEQIYRAREIDPLSVVVNSYVGAMLFNADRGEAAVPDGRSYVYSDYRILSDLFLATGLR